MFTQFSFFIHLSWREIFTLMEDRDRGFSKKFRANDSFLSLVMDTKLEEEESRDREFSEIFLRNWLIFDLLVLNRKFLCRGACRNRRFSSAIFWNRGFFELFYVTHSFHIPSSWTRDFQVEGDGSNGRFWKISYATHCFWPYCPGQKIFKSREEIGTEDLQKLFAQLTQFLRSLF